MVRGFRFHVGERHVQFPHVFIESPDVFFGHVLPGAAFFFGPVDDLVVDIGEIADVVHLVSQVL